MRKYIWLAAILVVAAVAGSYWTARYAVNHPGSFVARCMAAARTGFSLGTARTTTEHTAARGQTQVAGLGALAAAKIAATTPEWNAPHEPRVPEAPVAAPQEPLEVINIDALEQEIANAIGEMFDPQAQQPAVAPANENSDDQAVFVIPDGDGPIEICQPNIIEGQPAHCHGYHHCSHAVMPNCESGDTDCVTLVLGGAMAEFAAHDTEDVTTSACEEPWTEEPADLVMPYAEDDDAADDCTQPTPGDSTTEGTDSTELQQPEVNPYHHENEGCPYLQGRYCPRSTAPAYCPPDVAPAQEPQQPDASSEAEPQEPPQQEDVQSWATWFGLPFFSWLVEDINGQTLDDLIEWDAEDLNSIPFHRP